MKIIRHLTLTRIIALLVIIGIISSCSNSANKIPITTSSSRAKQNYLIGRELMEKLRNSDSRKYFAKAVADDPDFAMAHLLMAYGQGSQKAFMNSFNKALGLIDNVSPGEKIFILAADAGIKGDSPKQQELYQELTEIYPGDERAHQALANFFFGQHDYEKALEKYYTIIEIAPEFSAAYNQMGYCFRALEKYDSAEVAFDKYIQLIPNEPNPYDSYAELLLKRGKYQKSIEMYREALKIDLEFSPSHIGIATNYNLMGEHKKAREQLESLLEVLDEPLIARIASGARAVSYADEGFLDSALAELEKRYEIELDRNEILSAAEFRQLIARIHIEKGNFDKAGESYDFGSKIVEQSDLPDELKENSRTYGLYFTALIYTLNDDLKSAEPLAEQFREKAEIKGNQQQIRVSHLLNGIIFMKKDQFDKAISEFSQLDLGDSNSLFRLANAYEASGDLSKALENYKKAANTNSLNSLNYALTRHKAKAKAEELSKKLSS